MPHFNAESNFNKTILFVDLKSTGELDVRSMYSMTALQAFNLLGSR